MFGWILAVIMIVAAVFLFFGKGTWIVAGLNVLTEEEKKKINVKKTCRECGGILFISALVLIVQLIGILDLPYTAIYIGIIVVYILYSTLRK